MKSLEAQRLQEASAEEYRFQLKLGALCRQLTAEMTASTVPRADREVEWIEAVDLVEQISTVWEERGELIVEMFGSFKALYKILCSLREQVREMKEKHGERATVRFREIVKKELKVERTISFFLTAQ